MWERRGRESLPVHNQNWTVHYTTLSAVHTPTVLVASHADSALDRLAFFKQTVICVASRQHETCCCLLDEASLCTHAHCEQHLCCECNSPFTSSHRELGTRHSHQHSPSFPPSPFTSSTPHLVHTHLTFHSLPPANHSFPIHWDTHTCHHIPSPQRPPCRPIPPLHHPLLPTITI